MSKSGTAAGKTPLRRYAVVGVLMVIFSLSSGCDDDNWRSEKIQPPEAGSRVRIQVEVVKVRHGDVYSPIRATGTVVADIEARVSAKVSGRIEVVAVDEGDRLSEGRLIARLEQRDFELACKSALAQRDMVKASAREATLNLTNVTREKLRIENLYQRKVVSQQSYDDAVTAYRMALARVDVLEAQSKAAIAGLELAGRRLEDSRVTAPFSGYVTEKYVNEGECISPGMPIVTIMNIDQVKAEVKVPEMELTRVALGIPVDMEIDALEDHRFEGQISAINARVDPINRNFTVKIKIPNPQHLIKSGMFARITIKTDIIRDVPVVPERALVADAQGGNAVFMLENGKARRRSVIVGARGEGIVQIKEGLARGETILVSGNYGLTDGSEVDAREVGY